MRVLDLAEWLGATFEGDGEVEVTGAAPLENAGSSDLAFVANQKAEELAHGSAAGCLIVPALFPNPHARTLIRSSEPRASFARSVSRLYPPADHTPGVDPSASIARDVELGRGVSIEAHVSIGESTKIGSGTCISAGCRLGRRVVIGNRCVLHPNVTIYDNVDIGDDVILHAGVVIGADGFGFVMSGDRYEKFPQIGRVTIANNVEIGANSCVDRAALGVTWIGEGTKIDNMVHIGHNCRIGRHVVIAAQTGFSGGVTVDDYAVIGGQVGIGDKARIESRAVLGSGCGVLTSKIIRSGQTVWGTPARPLRDYLEMLANLSRLGSYRRELAALKKRVSKLEPET